MNLHEWTAQMNGSMILTKQEELLQDIMQQVEIIIIAQYSA